MKVCFASLLRDLLKVCSWELEVDKVKSPSICFLWTRNGVLTQVGVKEHSTVTSPAFHYYESIQTLKVIPGTRGSGSVRDSLP